MSKTQDKEKAQDFSPGLGLLYSIIFVLVYLLVKDTPNPLHRSATTMVSTRMVFSILKDMLLIKILKQII